MNNAVSGETMQNVRKYRGVKMITRWENLYRASYCISKPYPHSSLIIAEGTVLIELTKTSIKMNIPIFIEACILVISKTVMYDYHYNNPEPTCGERAKILYTDTDSLISQFAVEDIYEKIKRDNNLFDTSEYPQNNIFGIPRVNTKQLGRIKDESSGKIMTEFEMS